MQAVYSLVCLTNNRVYVGSSIDYQKRGRRHLSELKNNKHKNIHLQNAYNKYGREAFVFSLIEEVLDKALLIEKEQYYIDLLLPKFNICKVASSSLGVKRREATKEKVRAANLGLVHPEWRNKIKSEAQGKGNHWTKKKSFSSESKQKMSETHLLLVKVPGYIHPLAGKHRTKEQIDALAAITSKPILQYDREMNFIKEWKSAKATKEFGFIPSLVGVCAQGKRKIHKNFIWKYKNKA